MSSQQTSTAQGNAVRVAKVEKEGTEPVFNMCVKDNNNFAVNGGLIIHNCDALRYFVATMNIVRQKTKYQSILYPSQTEEPIMRTIEHANF